MQNLEHICTYQLPPLYTETGLLKEWPWGGPKMLWSAEGLGDGYSTVSIANGKIYTTELIGDHTLVTVEWGADQIAVKASKDFDGKQGENIGVVISRDDLFVFDAITGYRIR